MKVVSIIELCYRMLLVNVNFYVILFTYSFVQQYWHYNFIQVCINDTVWKMQLTLLSTYTHAVNVAFKYIYKIYSSVFNDFFVATILFLQFCFNIEIFSSKFFHFITKFLIIFILEIINIIGSGEQNLV